MKTAKSLHRLCQLGLAKALGIKDLLTLPLLRLKCLSSPLAVCVLPHPGAALLWKDIAEAVAEHKAASNMESVPRMAGSWICEC
jgi:hypothetical protein